MFQSFLSLEKWPVFVLAERVEEEKSFLVMFYGGAALLSEL